MSNAIVQALEDAAKKIGQAVEDAAKSVGTFFEDTAGRLKTAAKNAVEHDAKAAETLGKAAKDVGSPTVRGGASEVTRAAEAEVGAGSSAVSDEAARLEEYGRRVEAGRQKYTTDPITGEQFPPGYDPLHGQTIQQYIAQHGDGTFNEHGHPNWNWSQETTKTGAVGNVEREIEVGEGDVIDRYGDDYGRFASPAGTDYPKRALPAENLTLPYHRYRTLRPLPARQGVVAPAFGEPGGGIQYRLDQPLSHYLNAVPPYLEEIVE